MKAEARARREPRLWVFNLDAEVELERSGPYQTTKQLARALAPVLVHAQRLMLPEDVMLHDQAVLTRPASDAVSRPNSSVPRLGRCWCPTLSATKSLRRAGALPEPSPSLEILRRVNHRRFALELGGGAPGARYVQTTGELEVTLREENVEVWLCKRPFGFAGRGQRRIVRQLSADDRRWLDDSLRLGGLLIEPWLALVCELGLHGYLAEDGRVEFGRICSQRTDASRCWVASELLPASTLEPAQTRHLYERAERVAEELTTAGYFGPFGIDAYLWRSASGKIELNTLGELNARYSMGYAVGMAELLPFL